MFVSMDWCFFYCTSHGSGSLSSFWKSGRVTAFHISFS